MNENNIQIDYLKYYENSIYKPLKTVIYLLFRDDESKILEFENFSREFCFNIKK